MNEENPTKVLGKILNTEEDRIIKKQAISTLEAIEQSKIKAGYIGKFLGTAMPNVAIHVASLMCFFLWGLVLFSCETRLDVLKLVLPVFTLSLGYMFGKNDTK